MSYYKLELQNREENYNQLFSKNLRVGVMNPIGAKPSTADGSKRRSGSASVPAPSLPKLANAANAARAANAMQHNANVTTAWPAKQAPQAAAPALPPAQSGSAANSRGSSAGSGTATGGVALREEALGDMLSDHHRERRPSSGAASLINS